MKNKDSVKTNKMLLNIYVPCVSELSTLGCRQTKRGAQDFWGRMNADNRLKEGSSMIGQSKAQITMQI